MKSIPSRFHGPLAALGFAALMAIPAIAEWIGGLL
jgi:aryl carrier-like protein